MSGETALSKGIRQALTAKRCLCIRVQSGILPVTKQGSTHFVHCAPKGTPDLLIIRDPGVHTWLEVKPDDGKLSREQQAWHEWAVSHGVRVALVRSIDAIVRAVFT